MKIVDELVGSVCEHAFSAARWSWHSYRLLFAPVVTESLRARISKVRARAVAWSAAREVPAYRALLEEHGMRPNMRFEDLPIMDKPSYVHRFPLAATCRHGVLPTRGAVIDESSGSSGTANNWVRGPAERRATRRLIQYAARATFGERDFTVLNAFALGPWATGMSVSMALAERYLVKSIGPDVAKIVATLELLGPNRPYLICGYPPFLKLLCDTANVDWSRYEIYAAVGGEGMSEPLRAALERCFVRTISSFGASDLEINIAAENDFTIAVRHALLHEPSFARELFGVQPVPMVFQYDPLDYFLETTAGEELLVTVNRLANVSPRIRYNLRDRACVISRSRVLAIAADYGLRLPRALPLPLLFHWGRIDHAVPFYGCKLTPDDLQHAILRVPALAANAAEHALHPYEDQHANKRLDVWIELVPGSALVATPALEAALVHALGEVNQDFRESIRMVPPDRAPTIVLFPSGQSPLATQDVRIKKQYVVY
ncbi:MAG: phenylacetate--CoA ligase family protein [Kofleriaceae bacterium]